MAYGCSRFRVEYLPGKGNSLADALSRMTADQPLDDLIVGAITRSGHRTRGTFELSDGVSHSSKDLHLGRGHQK